MPRQLPVEVRRYYTHKRVDKKHELGPGWILKCDQCGEQSHVALPPAGQDFSAALIKHLLDHAISHTVPAPAASTPKLRLISTQPKKPKPIVVKAAPKVKPAVPTTSTHYEVSKEGPYVKVRPIPPNKHKPGQVEKLGATFSVTVEAANPRHAQVMGEGLIYRFLNPPRPTRSWRDKLTAE